MKKFLSIILAIVLTMGVVTAVPFVANGAEYANATELVSGADYIQGEISADTGEAWYKFTLTEASDVYLYVELSANAKLIGYVYEEDLNGAVDEFDVNYSADDSDSFTSDYYGNWSAGTYYLKLVGKATAFKIKLTSSHILKGNNAKEQEPNNYYASAQPLYRNKYYNGAITSNDRIDIYRFTLKNQSKVNIYQLGLNIGAESGLEYNIAKRTETGDTYFLNKKEYWYNQSEEYDYYFGETEQYENYFDDSSRSGVDSVLLPKGTYYLVINSKSLFGVGHYKVKIETVKPTPVFKYRNELNVKKCTIKKNKGGYLFVKGGGKVKKWSTSNKKIVRINQGGYFKGVKKGTVNITATLKNNKKLKFKVTVK